MFLRRDTSATTFLVIAATVGEAIFPIMVGSALKTFGAVAFPAMTVILVALMVIMYAIIHVWGCDPPETTERGMQLSHFDAERARELEMKLMRV